MHEKERVRLGRRSLVRAAAGTSVLGLSACGAGQSAEPESSDTGSLSTSTPVPAQTRAPDARTLLLFFSRAGENYYEGGRIDLEVGNTEVLAGMIAELTPCDVVRLEASEPYSEDYEETVDRNAREQDEDARPAIANGLPDPSGYGTVLIGSPIWNVRTPMIMSTLTDMLDFTGTTIHPFVTYAVSGLGSTESDYAAACPGAQVGTGLAVRGEDVESEGRAAAAEWLRQIGLTAGE